MEFPVIVDLIGHVLEVAGLAVIIGGVATVLVRAVHQTLVVRRDPLQLYQRARQNLGRSILLGLELLVGADIVRTIANRPSLDSVTVLGAIVAIRTFLSFTLEVELDGRWPWQRQQRS